MLSEMNEIGKKRLDWPWVTLQDVSTVVSKGTTPTTLGHSFTTAGIPFLRGEDVLGGPIDSENVAYHISQDTHSFLRRSQLKPGDLLVTIAGTLGRVGYVPLDSGELNCNQAVAFIRLNPELIDLEYACLACQAPDILDALLSVKKTGTIGNLNLTQIGEMKIPLPSLSEQKRISAIASKADRLRRTRRYTQQLSDTYLQSVFLEMFSGTDSNKWKTVRVKELVKTAKNTIRTGPFGSQLLHEEFFPEGDVAVLGIDNVAKNHFSWGKKRFIKNQKYSELKRYTVFPGDVLITIMGTCGRCVVVPDNIPLAINTKHLCCITLDQTRCLPTYLKYFFLMHPNALSQLGISERGAVMPGLNMGLIKELLMPLPSLPLQQKFATIVKNFERLCTQQREADRQAEHLFQSILHRAFRGEL